MWSQVSAEDGVTHRLPILSSVSGTKPSLRLWLSAEVSAITRETKKENKPTWELFECVIARVFPRVCSL